MPGDLRHDVEGPTPAARPGRPTHHVHADGLPGGPTVRALGPATAVDTGLSDHRAVVVDVVLEPAPGASR